MASPILLDTSVLIEALRGKPEVGALLEQAEDFLLISAITVHEVVHGIRTGEEERTDQLFEKLTTVPVDVAVARLSAEWRRAYAREGVTLDIPDTMIAATAFLQGATLATGNVKHFPMPELRVERWPPSEPPPSG